MSVLRTRAAPRLGAGPAALTAALAEVEAANPTRAGQLEAHWLDEPRGIAVVRPRGGADGGPPLAQPRHWLRMAGDPIRVAELVAEGLGWPEVGARMGLRAHQVRELGLQAGVRPEGRGGRPQVALRVPGDQHQLRAWGRAAAAAGQTVEAWAMATLDRAATKS